MTHLMYKMQDNVPENDYIYKRYHPDIIQQKIESKREEQVKGMKERKNTRADLVNQPATATGQVRPELVEL